MRQSGEVLFVPRAAGGRAFIAGRGSEGLDDAFCSHIVMLDEADGDLPLLLRGNTRFVTALERSVEDGAHYLAGGFERIPGVPSPGSVLRIDADGALDRHWRWRGPDAMAPHALACGDQPDWLYLAADHFVHGVLQHRHPLSRARLVDGVAEPRWRPEFQAVAAHVYVFRLLAHGRHLYVGGHFAGIDGVARSCIARFWLDSGTLDPDWAPRIDGWWVSTFAVAENWLYLGGEFSAVDGLPRSNLARVSLHTGHVDRHWIPQAADGGWESVEALAVHPDSGDVFVGRRVYSPRIRRQGLLRLSAIDGSRLPLDLLLPDGDVAGLLFDAVSQRLLVGGRFRNGSAQGEFSLMTMGLPPPLQRRAAAAALRGAAARRGIC